MSLCLCSCFSAVDGPNRAPVGVLTSVVVCDAFCIVYCNNSFIHFIYRQVRVIVLINRTRIAQALPKSPHLRGRNLEFWKCQGTWLLDPWRQRRSFLQFLDHSEGPHFAKPGASSSSTPDVQSFQPRGRQACSVALIYGIWVFPLNKEFPLIFHHVMSHKFTITPPVAKFLKDMVLALRVCFLRRAPLEIQVIRKAKEPMARRKAFIDHHWFVAKLCEIIKQY